MSNELNLETLSLSEARAAVVEGRVSAASLAEQHFERIADVDPAVHSYLALSKERALAQAERVDAAVKAGEPLGPLAGVPIGIKDVLAMQGAPATAGSRILEGYHPPYDATVVSKLEAAGAVLLGKLNCDEFAMGSSNENSAYGPVQNPKAPGRVPGGSSGGSGCGCGCWALRGFAGDGYGWVDPSAGGLLRCGGCAADVWPGVAIWADCVRFVAGSRGAVWALCGGCGDGAGSACRA